MNLIERKEIAPRVPRFSEVALAATFGPNRNIDESIKKIDLGSLVYEAQLLRDKTANDPKRREAGKLILITNDNFRSLLLKKRVMLSLNGKLDLVLPIDLPQKLIYVY